MPRESNNNQDGCVPFFTRRLVIPSVILCVVGLILLGPAVWAISNKPEDIPLNTPGKESLGPTLLVVSMGLVLMSVALMYSERRRMLMELTRNASTQDSSVQWRSQQDPLVTDTRAGDFLRAGRVDPKEKVAKLNKEPKV
ncbi:uncharacterized protein LOC135484506 isoform X1 [Lineus longissimus]|uniref:uncharacterized protein LOC135484506 isoform X1 n=1 Tax=Lineus longissimus TaxID=88925 RepID=UPI002B4E5661